MLLRKYMQTLPPLRPLTERSFLTTSNPGKYISLSLTELSIFVSLIASTSILESSTKNLRSSQCAGKPLILNAAITKPRPNGLIVEGLPLLGTLSIDNEMHDDDVRNPRRIGSRVSFLVGKGKLSSVFF